MGPGSMLDAGRGDVGDEGLDLFVEPTRGNREGSRDEDVSCRLQEG
jgi:hypothetical protein